MKVNVYFFAVSLCCMLPLMVQGADLDADPPEPAPRAKRRYFTPIIVESESGMLKIYFLSDVGEVNVCMQEATGAEEYSQQVDTSMQNQAVIAATSGTYILTIPDTAGNVIHQESVFIP